MNLGSKVQSGLIVISLLFALAALGMALHKDEPLEQQQQAFASRLAQLGREAAELEARAKDIDAAQARLQQAQQALRDQVARSSTEIDQQRAHLAKREQAVSQIEQAIQANSFADGNWEVGRDIQPGKYRTTNPSGRCYWEMNDGRNIIKNENETGPSTVMIGEGVPFFRSKGCGTWTKI